jgi:hypothetical protein
MNIKCSHQSKRLSKYAVLVFILCFTNVTWAEFIVSLRSPEIKNDSRENYNYELVTLALEKTKDEYGPYKILGIPPMNIARSLYSLEMNSYPNLLLELSYQKKLESESHLDYVYFPIVLGIASYRICFVSPKARDAVRNAKDINDLKKFTIAQGLAWADTEILRFNGFTVLEVSNYKSIFFMVANNRVDLFCRGANELHDEYESFKGIKNLYYDDSFSLFYPLPRFYYFNKNNTLLKERMEKGLFAAYQDGTLKALWSRHFLSSIEFAKLNQRKVHVLINPFMDSSQNNIETFLFNPMQ